MRRSTNWFLMGLMLLLGSTRMHAQTEFSLAQAIEYALLNNESVLNAELDRVDAEAQVGETRADGLPQVNANFGYTNNLFIAKSPIPNQFLGIEPADGISLIRFGAQHVGNLGINLEQMIWDGSFFVGLQAAKTLRELVDKDKVKAQIDVVELVTKAYYNVLISQKRIELIDANYANLDSTLQETRELYESGFAENIDVSRLQVQLNNLAAEKKGVEQAVTVSLNLLKFQMGKPVTEDIVLTDSLEAIDFTYPEAIFNNFNMTDRIEVEQLNFTRELAQLDLKNIKSQYIPKVSFSAGWGRNTGNSDFGDFWTGTNWFSNSSIGLNVNIPVFDGFRKKHSAQRKRVQISQLDNQFRQLTNNINQEIINSREIMTVSLERLNVQQANMDLAQEVYDITREKYREGVGSNLEVLNAEEDLKEAEINYLSALFDAIIAKVDLDKAIGKLYDPQQ